MLESFISTLLSIICFLIGAGLAVLALWIILVVVIMILGGDL